LNNEECLLYNAAIAQARNEVMSTKKEQTRQRIIEAAGQGVKEHGYGGIGVDGIAKAAGVTSGAIYAHFGSKDKVFQACVSKGMADFVEGAKRWHSNEGEQWLMPFIEWYLSCEKRHDISGGCALPGLTADVARAGQASHLAYEEQLVELIELVAGGMPQGDQARRKQKAWALLSILSGGVTMSRAVDSKALAKEIANGVVHSAKQLVNDP
jgi:AcrR family transcriptional regulator